MFPRESSHDESDVVCTDAELLSQFSRANARFMEMPYFYHRSIAKFGVGMLFPTQLRGIVSTLANHVMDIVGLRTQEQMLRVSAGGIIAPVENRQAFGYRAVVEFVRKTVGRDILTNTLKMPVPKLSNRPKPAPTSVGVCGFGNPVPKPDFNGLAKCYTTTAFRAKRPDSSTPTKKPLPALLAEYLDLSIYRTCVMPTNKAFGPIFNLAPLCVCLCGYRRVITAATHTVATRIRFWYTHVVFPFTRRLGRAEGVSAPLGLSISNYTIFSDSLLSSKVT